MSKIILMPRAWRQIYKRIKKQGYVWIKLKDNCIITDEVYKYFRHKTVFFQYFIEKTRLWQNVCTDERRIRIILKKC